MFEYVEIATTVLLLVLFAAAEIYRLSAPKRGRLISCEPIAGGLGGYNAKVELKSGDVADVYISPCVMCAGRLEVGSEVIVHKTKNGLVASVPLVCSLENGRCG